MDLLNMNMGVLCVLLVVVVVVVTIDASEEKSDWLARSLRAASREKRTHTKDRRNSIDAGKNGLTVAADEQESCCFKSRGTCIMNSFCHCKKNYYGRFCEHRVRHRSCGTIRHGTWMAAGCHLCHCFDGKMTCKVTTIRGCDKLSYVEGYEKDPDYMVGMDKKVEDYDKFYDEYDYSPETEVPVSGSSKSEVSAWQMITTVMTMVVLKHFNP